ncbi:MAG: [LysW]-aminoadipate/[LysW]-glutamate kinase [Nitrososphaerota archaeon]|nr:[LysW]-aminoadipate/[LysW]-glutamate kinase [Nitrososphaerota archaeon]MDG7025157.1 [LysW]-aminoadipate/[LysW]-glutamate kinase [Nitrososphaerota archaeon]
MRVVVKVGGSLMKAGAPDSLVRDAARLFPSNQLVLVHGGGDVVTEYATRLGKEQRFVVSPDGIRSRYTDRETAEIYQMVMSGYLAKRLVQALYGVGVKGVSLAGVDGSMISATRKSRLVIVDERGRKVAIEGGYTGRVRDVDPSLLDLLLGRGYLPIISPLAQGEGGEPLNIDGDRAAASIAAGAGADVVVFATNVDGLSLDGALVGRLSAEEASASLPKIGFGMQKKVIAAVEAVRAGVREAVICSGTREGPITRAISHEGCTVVTR